MLELAASSLKSHYHFRAFLLITGHRRSYVHVYCSYSSWSSSLVWCCMSCISSSSLVSSWNWRTFFTHRTTRPTICYPVLVIHLENHTLHYTRPDCFAGWRLRRCCFLFFSLVSLRHRPSPRKRQHVYTYTHHYTATILGRIGVGLMGGWGIVPRVWELAFHTESSRFTSLRRRLNLCQRLPI